MKKDILFKKVENVGIAIVPQVGENLEKEWNVYLINLLENELDTVLVNIKGYGVINEREKVTETVRINFGNIPPMSYVKIEPIHEELFELNNEYWISFWLDGDMMDKKFVFDRGSIKEENFRNVPLLEKQGVIII